MAEIGWRDKQHFLSIKDSSKEDIEFILHVAKILRNYSGKGNKLDILKGHILAPIFFEESTRTLNSSMAAMMAMGGDNLAPYVELNSSTVKGEKKLDTLIAYSQFCDIIAIRDRNPDTMLAYTNLPKRHRLVPLINCGSGTDEHPTQTLLDLRTIQEELGTLEDLLILIAGDLKYGRVPHSLMYGIRKFPGNKIIGFPVKDLKLPDKYKDNSYEEHDITELPRVIREIPPYKNVVLYITRVQWERKARELHPEFDQLSEQEREKFREDIRLNEYFFEITSEIVNLTPQKTRVLHPLPRGPEISDDLFYSEDPKIAPINQMRYGLDVRMAIEGLYCGKEEEILSLAKAA